MSGSASASMAMSLPVQSTPTEATCPASPQLTRTSAVPAAAARRVKRHMVISLVLADRWLPAPACSRLAGLPMQITLQQPNQQRQRDRHGEIKERHDVVGLEEQETGRGR